MRYLITTRTQPPFFTEWFSVENNFNLDSDMVVYDLQKGVYMDDGATWETIEEDHL